MIPVFDLQDFQKDPQSFAQAFGEAFHTFGFIRLKGHGISRDVMEAADKASRNFFAQPQDVKDRYWNKGQEGIMSYTRNFEVARGEKQVDLKEEWCIRTQLPPENPLASRIESLLTVPEVPGFKEAEIAMDAAYRDFTLRLMRPFAVYFDLDKNWFDDKFDRSHSTMRIISYPTAGTAAKHVDLNLITVLRSKKPGLYVIDINGDRHEVVAEDDEIILNTGMQMGVMTNNHITGMPHGVIAKDPRESGVYFIHPNPDFVLKALPKFENNPPVSKPDFFPPEGQGITVADFVQQEVRKIFTGSPAPKP